MLGQRSAVSREPTMTLGSALYAAVEAGGTKFVCALARSAQEIVAVATIPTTQPEETMAQVRDLLRAWSTQHGTLGGLGIAAFGPLELRRQSPDYGRLLETPKPGWSRASFLDPLRELRLGCEIAIDTDVNAAALAEYAVGAGRGHRSVVYVTVGTGIGGGAVINGVPLHGWLHPEMGHIQVRRDPRDLAFPGTCPFHGDCLEGLACGVAIQRRWHSQLSALPEDHQAHDIIGGYLGQLAATIMLILSPELIVFGGGVMSTGSVLQPLRESMRASLAGYLPARASSVAIEETACLSPLQGRAGIIGAILLAQAAAEGGGNAGQQDRSSTFKPWLFPP
jgi:fructokinase